MGKKITDLKSENCVTCYVQMLQDNISRMSSLSGIIKAAMCVVYTIYITIYVTIDKFQPYWWVGIVITIIGMIIDAYYLALEKTYVIKYDSFVDKLNNGILDEKEIYDMKPKNTNIKCEMLAMTLTSLKS